MDAWIAHQKYIRKFNMTMLCIYIALVIGATVYGGLKLAGIAFLFGFFIGGLFIGLANVAFLLGTPPVHASADEIRSAAAHGPKWLKRLVAKLDAQP